ncbi:MAG: peptidoglycan bridge formation glycyltransferase FemA/FemB family protein [Chloroflexota bacterium]
MPETHFQQSWEWGDLAPELGGDAVRLGAVEDGNLIGAMQVFVTPINYLRRTYLYVPRGPAVCRPSAQILGPLLDACRNLGFEKRAVGIRIEPNAPGGATGLGATLRALGLHAVYPPSQPRSSWILDITPGTDELLASMKSKTRYNIRLATRKGVRVRQGKPADLDAFYRLYRETGTRDDFFIQPKRVYERMFQLFRDSGRFCMLLAEYEDELIAAVTLFTQGSTCWYMHGASSNRHRNLMAPYQLQWNAIQWARDQGCSLYDFRAVPDVLREDQDMYGVYRFKEGFGGSQYTTLHTYAAPYDSWLFGLWQAYFSGRFAAVQRRRRRQGLPLRQFA